VCAVGRELGTDEPPQTQTRAVGVDNSDKLQNIPGILFDTKYYLCRLAAGPPAGSFGLWRATFTACVR
jgi:hypothetical protein